MRRAQILQLIILCLAAKAFPVWAMTPQIGERARLDRQRGLEQFWSGRYEEAIESFKRAVSLQPDYYDAQNDLGVTYVKLGRLEEAVEAFKRAIRV